MLGFKECSFGLKLCGLLSFKQCSFWFYALWFVQLRRIRFGSKVCVLGLQRKFALVSNSVVCNSFGLKLCGLQDFNECFSASVVV